MIHTQHFVHPSYTRTFFSLFLFLCVMVLHFSQFFSLCLAPLHHRLLFSSYTVLLITFSQFFGEKLLFLFFVVSRSPCTSIFSFSYFVRKKELLWRQISLVEIYSNLMCVILRSLSLCFFSLWSITLSHVTRTDHIHAHSTTAST